MYIAYSCELSSTTINPLCQFLFIAQPVPQAVQFHKQLLVVTPPAGCADVLLLTKALHATSALLTTTDQLALSAHLATAMRS